MSRSYRRPYSGYTCYRSCKYDKQIAARGLRRAFNHSLRECSDFEEYVPVHPREGPHSNPYGWSRDCSRFKTYHYFPNRFDLYMLAQYGEEEFERYRQIFEQMKRK